ncbi:alginate export family protein [bacterium]|nr:alginate export family protein [bacterium]
MRRVLPLFLLAFILIPFLANAELPILEKDGDPLVTMDLELRPRWELDGRDFDSNTGFSDYGTMRTMIGIDVLPMDDFMLRLNVQESRYLGTALPEETTMSIWDLREAYFRVDNLFDLNIAIQAGRFTWQTGRGRIFGYNDWHLFGPNAYDGVLLEWPCWLMPDKGRWSLLIARVQDYNYAYPIPDYYVYPDYPLDGPGEMYVYPSVYGTSRHDRNLYVFAGDFFDGRFQPFVSADIDPRKEIYRDDYYYYYGEKAAFAMPYDLYHAGAYVGDTWNNLTFNVDAAYQWGTLDYKYRVYYWENPDMQYRETKFDLNSWLIAADVEYQFDMTSDPALKLGVDYTYGSYDIESEGQFNPISRNQPQFRTPFASNREFRGYLNLNWASFPRLADYYGTLSASPAENLRLQLGYHRFIFGREDVNKSTTVDLGAETSVMLDWQVNDYLAINGGYALFTLITSGDYPLNPNDPYESFVLGGFANDHDPAGYGWLTATVRF